MTTKQEEILDAIERANKLGAKGVKVIGYAEPYLATQPPVLLLITEIPQLTSASDAPWYDE